MKAKHNIDTGKISKKLLLQLGFAIVVLMMAYFVWTHFDGLQSESDLLIKSNMIKKKYGIIKKGE